MPTYRPIAVLPDRCIWYDRCIWRAFTDSCCLSTVTNSWKTADVLDAGVPSRRTCTTRSAQKQNTTSARCRFSRQSIWKRMVSDHATAAMTWHTFLWPTASTPARMSRAVWLQSTDPELLGILLLTCIALQIIWTMVRKLWHKMHAEWSASEIVD